jgi:uncharacterized OB-fold protein
VPAEDRGWLPVPTDDSQPFWDGCLAGQLRLPRCQACGRLNWFPRAMCRYCSATELEWIQVSGRGRVYTFTTVHRAPGEVFEVPYVLALVDLDEGVRMMTHVVDCPPDQLRVGLPVEVRFHAASADIALPVFAPRVT